MMTAGRAWVRIRPSARLGKSGRWTESDPAAFRLAPTGHGMKVADYAKAQGAILGKDMPALKEGTGLVLALVSLQ